MGKKINSPMNKLNLGNAYELTQDDATNIHYKSFEMKDEVINHPFCENVRFHFNLLFLFL